MKLGLNSDSVRSNKSIILKDEESFKRGETTSSRFFNSTTSSGLMIDFWELQRENVMPDTFVPMPKSVFWSNPKKQNIMQTLIL